MEEIPMFNRFRVWLAKSVLPKGYEIKPPFRTPLVAEIKQLWKETIQLDRKRDDRNAPTKLSFRISEEELSAAEAEAAQLEIEMRNAIAAARSRIQEQRED